jgi:Mrp family chromosome partitioning ATPase/capsular polysaccharide biosynthesis protein
VKATPNTPGTIRLIEQAPAGMNDSAQRDDVANQEKPLRLAVAAMRGRHGWALLLASVLGVCGAVGGWFLSQPLYRSFVLIQIAQDLKRVMFADEEKGSLPSYDRYVETKTGLMRSQRVLEGAVDQLAKDEGWRQAHIKSNTGMADQAVIDLAENLTISRNNELVYVYVTDPDRKFAMLGAQAVVDSFGRVVIDGEAQFEKARLEKLQQLERNAIADVASHRQKIADITRKFGAEDLDKLYDARFDLFRKLQATKVELQLDLTMATAGANAPANAAEGAVEDVADPFLFSLKDERRKAEIESLTYLSQGLGAEHPKVTAAQKVIGLLNERIAEREAMLKANPPGARVPVNLAAGGKAIVDPQRIEAQLAEVDKLYNDIQDQMVKLSNARTQLLPLKAQLQNSENEQKQFRARIDILNVEATSGGRISVLGDAQRPLELYYDPRRKRAVLGGLMGAMGGYLIVLMLALTDRRLRHSHDVCARLNIKTILGMLPALPKDLADPEQAALASHCVHHIRSMLQIRSEGGGAKAYTITSPMAGAGKTSLAIALGLSYASTGSRTLMIDCDLIGGGLTSRLKGIALRHKLGRLLARKGKLNDMQLHAALREASQSKVPLGQHLVQKGLITERELEDTLRLQREGPEGLSGALKGLSLDQCIAECAVHGLWVMDLGKADARHASGLSPATIAALLKRVKRCFDTILIDTGPILGSLEAGVVSAQADSVVLVVPRGESSSLVEQSSSRLDAVGAELAGLVFNRAADYDIAAGSTTSRMSSPTSSSRLLPDFTLLDKVQGKADFGPVAQAVAASVASTPISSRHRSVRSKTIHSSTEQ